MYWVPPHLYCYFFTFVSLLRCVCVLVSDITFPILCVLLCDYPTWPLSPHSAQVVLAELQEAELITSDECRGLNDASDVVGVQRGKSPEVLTKTADVLRRRRFPKTAGLLTGKLALPLTMCLWCVVQWSLVVRPLEDIHHYCIFPAPSAGL